MIHPFYTLHDADASIQAIQQNQTQEIHLDRSGICCISMLVEQMLELSFPLEVCARFALRCGAATEPDGIKLLAGAVAGRFSLRLCLIRNVDEAFRLIESGGRAVISEPGHYILLEQLNDQRYLLTDPAHPKGKGMPRILKRQILSEGDRLIIGRELLSYFINPESLFYIFRA